MRLIMMGTGPFAVPTFQYLLDSPHHVAALFTRPAVTAPTRGKATAPRNPMREVAEVAGVEILAPADVNDPEAHRLIAQRTPDLFVVCDYGQILSAETLSLAPLGGINLHGSLLPKYRGAAPVNWAIWDGEAITGVTVIHMTPKLDAGPSLAQSRTEIGPDETAEELEKRLAVLGVTAVDQALQILATWDRSSPVGNPQHAAQATRAPRLKKSDGEVDWSRSADAIYRQFRALQPWPGVFTSFCREGQPALRLILNKIAISPTSLVAGAPGHFLESDPNQLIVATGGGAILLEQVQPAGKRCMGAAEFRRGYRLQPGDRLGTA